jgi:HSP20 family protein
VGAPLGVESWCENLDEEVRQLIRDIDDVLGAVRDTRVPVARVDDLDDRFVLDVELPGVRQGDVSVEVCGRRVLVTGEHRERAGLLRRRTRSTRHFRLDTVLPADVDPDGVVASLHRGTLTVRVPKAEYARRRRVPVTA